MGFEIAEKGRELPRRLSSHFDRMRGARCAVRGEKRNLYLTAGKGERKVGS